MPYRTRRWLPLLPLAFLAGCGPATTAVAPTNAVQAPLGRFVLLRSGADLAAVKLTRHTPTADGGAEYVWFYWGDGAGNLIGEAVETGRGEVFERYAGERSGWNSNRVTDVGGRLLMTCGPFRIEWSQGDWLYFPPGRGGLEMAVTPWSQVEDIDFEDPNLKWRTATDPP